MYGAQIMVIHAQCACDFCFFFFFENQISGPEDRDHVPTVAGLPDFWLRHDSSPHTADVGRRAMRWYFITLLSWIAHQLVCAGAFKEISLPCAKGCEAIGNCNREFGTCECPIGRTGPHGAALPCSDAGRLRRRPAAWVTMYSMRGDTVCSGHMPPMKPL